MASDRWGLACVILHERVGGGGGRAHVGDIVLCLGAPKGLYGKPCSSYMWPLGYVTDDFDEFYRVVTARENPDITPDSPALHIQK